MGMWNIFEPYGPSFRAKTHPAMPTFHQDISGFSNRFQNFIGLFLEPFNDVYLQWDLLFYSLPFFAIGSVSHRLEMASCALWRAKRVCKRNLDTFYLQNFIKSFCEYKLYLQTELHKACKRYASKVSVPCILKFNTSLIKCKHLSRWTRIIYRASWTAVNISSSAQIFAMTTKLHTTLSQWLETTRGPLSLLTWHHGCQFNEIKSEPISQAFAAHLFLYTSTKPFVRVYSQSQHFLTVHKLTNMLSN